MSRISLTEVHRAEYDRLIQTCITLGWAWSGWTGPEFKARRTQRRRGVTGTGCPMRVALVIGCDASLADVHQTLAHEIAHVITHDEKVDHGPEFRTKLRQLMRARWPGLEPWRETNTPGAQAAYWEDAEMSRALERHYAAARRPTVEIQAHG